MMKKACMAAVMVLSLWCVEAFGQEQERGSIALPGIDTLPMDAIQLSNKQMRNLFIVTDPHSVNAVVTDANRLRPHAKGVQNAACNGYIIQCDYTVPSTKPFTFIGFNVIDDWLHREVRRRGGKIVTSSQSHGGPFSGAAMESYINVNSAGNVRDDNFFRFANAVYDRKRDVFVKEDGQTLGRGETWLFHIRDAVKSQKIIYTSTYTLDGQANIVPVTTGCLGVEESCVWLPAGINHTATSIQSPRLGAALASLLAVFPEYDVFDIAALTNSCALPHPNLPGGGIVNILCMIETICEETRNKSSACSVEQPVLKFSWRDTSFLGMLENPTVHPDVIYSERSGISAISGWVCDAEEIIIEINGEPLKAGYGTIRTDTADPDVCGDSDNGFSLLWNWNLLKDGVHTVEAFADGRKFASTQVRVTTLGKEFVRNMNGETTFFIPSDFADIFADGDKMIEMKWIEALQNFVITDFVDLG